jgi:hypothetical protein
MPAPTSATFSLDVRIAAHDALLTLIEAGAGTPAVELRSAADAVLASYPLSDPAGVVSGTTGQLALSIATDTANAAADGTIAYAAIVDGDGDDKLTLPAATGTAAVSGFAVVNQLAVLTGAPVTLLSVTIG